LSHVAGVQVCLCGQLSPTLTAIVAKPDEPVAVHNVRLDARLGQFVFEVQPHDHRTNPRQWAIWRAQYPQPPPDPADVTASTNAPTEPLTLDEGPLWQCGVCYIRNPPSQCPTHCYACFAERPLPTWVCSACTSTGRGIDRRCLTCGQLRRRWQSCLWLPFDQLPTMAQSLAYKKLPDILAGTLHTLWPNTTIVYNGHPAPSLTT
jgi:hypothetical protein